MKKKNNLSAEEQEFEKYLEKIEVPNNQEGVNRGLPENATPLQVAKYHLCKQMLIYQQDNNLTDEEVANRISLSLAETQDILFGWIEKFTLDRLVEYAGKLLTPSRVEIIVKHTDNHPKEHVQTT
jgi:hypothetical protein